MKRFLRLCLRALLTVVVLLTVLAVLFAWFVYTPAASLPPLSGSLKRTTIDVNGLQRTYLTYIPQQLPNGAPLVLVLHGSGGGGAQMRAETGYGFDRMADQHAFAVVYPYANEGYWDACNVVGSVSSGALDDVAFLSTVVDRLVGEIGVDPQRVFAAGSSRGGSMALRLALEAPQKFRAVAAVSANLAAPENFKCKPAGNRTPSVMIMNGTDDPLVPFGGGQVSLFGLLYKNGNVLSSRDSAQYFADLNRIAARAETRATAMSDDVSVERVLWRDDAKVEVELVAIHGAGHGIPQPYRRRPRILGPSPAQPNGVEVIWEFFARQRP